MACVDKLHSSILWHLLFKRFCDKQALARQKEYLVGLDLILETRHGVGGVRIREIYWYDSVYTEIEKGQNILHSCDLNAAAYLLSITSLTNHQRHKK